MNTQNDSPGYTKQILGSLLAFFSEVPGSLKNHLNQDELGRVIIASLTAGGGIFGFLQLLVPEVAKLFPDPADAALAGAVLTLILETRRRLSHGVELTGQTLGRRLAR